MNTTTLCNRSFRTFTRKAFFFATGVAVSLAGSAVLADVWVFEPSITLDQRIDDNYYLLPGTEDTSLSATRAVGELGFSRQSQIYSIKGIARVDALLTTSTDVGDENLDSNQILGINAQRRSQRSRYGAIFNYTRDTPSRDIAADISEDGSIATDTGLTDTQSLYSNVARTTGLIETYYEYDITRRLQFDADVSYSDVQHGFASLEDILAQATIDGIDINSVTAISGELDDFTEAEAQLGLKYQYSRIETLSTSFSISQQVSQVEVDADFAFQTRVSPDYDLYRFPRRESVSSTTTVRLGYERLLTPLLKFGISGGVYNNKADIRDSFDVARNVTVDGITKSDGWLADLSLSYDAGLTQYSAVFAVDVEPSSSGSQVETNQLSGKAERILSPRLKVSLSGRAYEPDRLVALVDDRFARRFISIEPKVQWQYSRNWTLTAAYRYRRQKARVDLVSSESNAILLAIKFTPPSEIRDAAAANGF